MTMRLQCMYTALLVLVVLVASLDAVSAATNSDRQTLTSPDSATLSRTDQNAAHNEKVLGTNDEERAVSTSALEKLASLVKSGASKVTEKLRLWYWRLRDKSADDVFTLLKLDKTGKDLFDSPKLNTWVNYMAIINKKDPEAAMISSLTARYGDEFLAKMIVEAKQVSTSASIANKLQSAQIQTWVKNHETMDDVFTFLKLDKTGEFLFRSPQFDTWAGFVSVTNSKNPKVAMMLTLSSRYSDDTLAKMIEAATKVPRTESIATKLQTDLLNRWRLDRKSTDDVFKLLRLDKGGDIIGSAEFNTWAIYTTVIIKKDPEKAMISTLTTHYGDETLSGMVETARKVRETKEIATDLQNAQFKNWLAQDFTPTKVRDLLGMKNGLCEPNAIVWYVYKAHYEVAKGAKAKV